MKTQSKRLLSLIMALAMILSLLPVMAFAATPETLYLKPNSNWAKDSARFAAYFFGNGEKWVSMTDSDGDGYYEVTVPSGYSKVIFCRMNPGASANNWDNKWNQTGDLTIPTDGKNCFTVPSGAWDGSTTGWGTYTPVVVPEFDSPIVAGDSVTFNYWNPSATTVYVAGNMNSWNSTANPMTKKEEGIWTTTISGLTNKEYQYKFVVDAKDWIIDPKNDQIYTEVSGNQNSLFTITDGIVPTEPTRDVTIHYRNTNVWKDSLYIYAWNIETADFLTKGWPGSEMTLEAEHANWYTATVAVPVSLTEIGVQFDNDAYKTDELTLTSIPTDAASEYWYDDLTSTEFLTTAPESWADGSVEIPEPQYPEIVYLLPNFNWTSNNAAIAAYFFNDTENTWVYMSDGNGDGVYEAVVPEGMTSVIFCRMDPNGNLGWNSEAETNVWNQSADLAIPTDGTNLYISYQNIWGVDDWAGTWETYAESTVPAIESPVIEGNSVTFNYWHYGATSVSVHGTMDSWGEGYAMTKGEDGVWSVTISDLDNAQYQYKLVVDDAWILDPANNEVYSEYDEYGSIVNQNSLFMIGTPVAEIYDVGVYFTFEDAYAAVDSANGYVVTLQADVTIDGLAVDKELYLDLNGHDATFTNTTGEETIWVQDSATTNYETTEWGTLITDANYECLGSYIMLDEAEGHSFHSYELTITHISLKPADDALGFKAQLEGDSAVQNAVSGFGFDMSANGGESKTFTKDGKPSDGTFTLRLKNILACGGGEMDITASAFVIFNETEYAASSEETTTMKQAIQAVDAAWETAGYTQTQKDAVQALVNKYYTVTQHWGLENMNPIFDLPIESSAA